MYTWDIVLLDSDLDLLSGPVGGSRQWINDTVNLSLIGRQLLVSLARPSRKERRSGQTAIVELWQSIFHCPSFRRHLSGC